MSDRHDSSTMAWDRIADDWVRHADQNDYRNHFLLPLTLQMLGSVQNRRILDLGCGEGGYSRELARRGAKVVGVDGSARLIEIARQRAAAEGVDVDHVCANASALEPLAPATFDIVLAAMSLMDVEDYENSVRECQRVLVTGGELLMSILHPCFTTPNSHWIRDDAGRPSEYVVDRYFGRISWPDRITPRFREPVIRHHRPLEDYMRAPLACGFILREFTEPTATEADIAKSPRFEKLTRIPYFLFMRWIKVDVAA